MRRKASARGKYPIRKLAVIACPYCRKLVEVMPSGLMALHPVTGRWAKSMCRGSGAPAVRRPRSNSKSK